MSTIKIKLAMAIAKYSTPRSVLMISRIVGLLILMTQYYIVIKLACQGPVMQHNM